MGQYHIIVNVDKQQFLHPHSMGDGLKLLEFGCSSCGTMTALAVLLADSNGEGGGDLHIDDPTDIAAIVRDLPGSWAGDRIIIAGDYGDEGKYLDEIGATQEDLIRIAKARYSEGYQQPERVNLYAYAQDMFEDISLQALATLMQDQWMRSDVVERIRAAVKRDRERQQVTEYFGYSDYVAYVWQISRYFPAFRKQIREASPNYRSVADSDRQATIDAREKLKRLIEQAKLRAVAVAE